ncbi:hypothetical protein [Desulfosporosinus sp. SB140]|uniref:hypothetical protein n=1 Tax=Desulfosporosinus paludis TaxID=3115649 RepID=UPI00388E7646
MIHQQVRRPNYIEKVVKFMKKEKPVVVKIVEVKKTANVDITQTKEFWSTLAVIS